MKATKFGLIKIAAHGKASQVLTPILIAIATIGLISGLSACGSGAVGSPPDTTPVASTPLAVSPPTADLFPDVPTTFTITGGKPGYSAFSSNSVVLPVTATLPSATFTVIPGPVTAETTVDITVRDTANASASAKATVKPSTLNNQITFTPSAPAATGCGAALCNGNDAQVVVRAALNGVALRSVKIRFEAIQGSFTISSGSCVPPSTPTSCTVPTDNQGEAAVTVVANKDAQTQFATLKVSDGVQSRNYSFNIIQQTSGLGILSVLPSTSVVLQGLRGVAGVAAGAGACPNAQLSYSIFGGTPPYTVVSSLPQVAAVANSPFDRTFSVTVSNATGCGQAVFVISDFTGRTIQTAVLDLQRGPDSVSSTVDSPFLVSPQSLTLCPNSKAGVTLSGTGTYVAAIGTSIKDNIVTLDPPSGSLPAAVTFTRTTGVVPGTVDVNFSDGKNPKQYMIDTPSGPPKCP
jgi:hypothetical protein